MDKNPTLLARARGRRIRVSVRDVCGFYPSQGEVFDYGIARLLAQHLPSLNKFLASSARSIRSGGHLLVMDAEDSLGRWHPRLPSVESALHQLALSEAFRGIGRDTWEHSLEKSARRHGFQKVLSLGRTYKAVLDKRSFHAMYFNLGKLMKLHFGMVIDERTYRNELAGWLRHPRSQGQFGMRAVLLVRS